MKRIRRWVFNGFAGASILLFVLTVAAWALSHIRIHPQYRVSPPGITYVWQYDNVGYQIILREGAIGLETFRYSRPMDLSVAPDAYSEIISPNNSGLHGFGFHYSNTAIDKGGGTTGNINEFWFELTWPLFISLPMTAFVTKNMLERFLQKRKRPDNICATCGYDLRATPNRCPECGTVPAKNFSHQNPKNTA